MKSKLSLTVVYIVLIIYFKVRLPDYTVAELENDLKITLHACYNDALIPLWKHFMYDGCSDVNNEPPNKQEDDTSKKKSTNDGKLVTNPKKGSSCLEHYDSWKVQDDLRIHPIDDVGPSKPGSSCSTNPPKLKSRKSIEVVRKLEDDIVVTTTQILASNVASSTVHAPSKPPSTVEPPKENKSSTQFGEYVPGIQQWEDKSRTKATRPPTCNC